MKSSVFLHMPKKGVDQLHSNHAADHLHCFRYIDCSILLLPKSEISSLKPSSVVVRPGLFGNSEDRSSQDAAQIHVN